MKREALERAISFGSLNLLVEAFCHDDEEEVG